MNRNGRRILKNLIIFVILLIILIIGILVFLKKYTHHNESIVVPDVTSLTVGDAAVFFEKKGLRYKVVDSLYVNSKMPGTIIEQKPAPGSRVKQNRFIFLTINAFSKEKIVLPNVLDFSQRQAIATLEASGIKVANIEYAPSEFKDLVMGVRYNGRKIDAGMRLPKGSLITLIVGQGDTEGEIKAPSFQGMSLDKAIDEVHRVSLNMGNIHYDVTPKDAEDAKRYRVYKQKPVSETPTMMGAKIELWMTTDKSLIEAPAEVYEPDEENSEFIE